MFKKLFELIKQALRKMVQIQNITEIVGDDVYTVSDTMQEAVELWTDMYKDDSPWLDDSTGVFSLGIAPYICSNISSNIINELNSNILEPGQDVKDIDESKETEISTRAQYLNDVYHKNLLKDLQQQLEQALAVGGMVVKPYISNGTIYYNYCMQGEFIPLGFTDDGVMNDVAFYDDFIEGTQRFRRVERHVWNQADKTDTIINTAYVAKIEDIKDRGTELGNPIKMSDIPRWKDISDEPVVIQDVEKPLYGYFRVAKANNIDRSSPLGISLFSRATNMIKRADIQFSRLDWEYEGGQMAVDVDTTASTVTGSGFRADQLRDRLYRKIDIGSDDTYNVFAPGLRDSQYMAGLNYYLMRIEDLCEISRGTISEVQSEARTATELKILQQRSYNTIANNQKALEQCLDDAIYATNALVELYNLAPAGDYTTTHEWSDSVLTDTDAELAQKLQLVSADILSTAEVRAWYCGEDIETAQAMIQQINESKVELADLFTQTTTEADTDDEKEDEEDKKKDVNKEEETNEKKDVKKEE